MEKGTTTVKITTFNPQIITNHLEEVVGLFEALGFEKRHTPSGTGASGNAYTDCRMKDANGFYVDVAATSAAIPRDIASIRMNVDDFDAAYQLLTDHGFKPSNGTPATESDSAKGLLMVSPSGFGIVLVKHIKKED